MKEKISFKKTLSAISLLTVSTTISTSLLSNIVNFNLNVSMSTFASDIVNRINNLTDLTIDISANEIGTTVFHILNHDQMGIATRLSKHHEIAKDFEIDLFKLHPDKVFADKDGEILVLKDTIVEIKTYYFQFSYANQENNALVPIKITNIEQEIISAINHTPYEIGVWVGSSVKSFKAMIDDGFIKSQLHDVLQQKYKRLFHLNEIMINGRALTETDLASKGDMKVIFNYDYGSFTNQNANLNIAKKPIVEVTPEKFVLIAKERASNSPMKFPIKVYEGSGDYVPDVLKIMAQEIEDEYLNVYRVKIDLSKLKLEKITSWQMIPTTIDTAWFKKKTWINAYGSCSYAGLSTGPLAIVLDVTN